MDIGGNKTRTPCRRCGVSVTTLHPPPIQLIDVFKKYGGICANCLTPEELDNMKTETYEAIALAASNSKPAKLQA